MIRILFVAAVLLSPPSSAAAVECQSRVNMMVTVE